MHRIIAALVAATACAPVAQAQITPSSTAQAQREAAGGVAGETLTLDRAVALAIAAAPGLEAASAGIRSAEALRRAAGLRPNPSASFETENILGSGPFSGVGAAETTAGLSVPLERGGKRMARVGLADAQTSQARLDAVIATADLRLRVTQAYIQAAAADRRIAVAREQRDIAGEGLRAATARVRAGRASPLEAQRADLLRINAVTALGQAERAATLARANLGRLIGRVPGLLDSGWLDRVTPPGPQLAASADATLALAQAQAEVTTAEARLRLARSQRVPDLTLSAAARRLEVTNDVAAVFGVSIPLPVFNGGRANLDAARAQQDQAMALRRAAMLDAEQAIGAAETDVANAAANARAATGPALAAAQEAARIARIGYREGKFGQLDLLEAERTLAQTRASAIDALAAYHDAKARLERLTARASTNPEDRP